MSRHCLSAAKIGPGSGVQVVHEQPRKPLSPRDPAWQMRRDLLSPRYTTRLDELWRVG